MRSGLVQDGKFMPKGGRVGMVQAMHWSLNIRQSDIAKILGISRQAVFHYIRGNNGARLWHLRSLEEKGRYIELARGVVESEQKT